MDALLNFAPLLLFLVVYKLRGIYAGTMVLMAAMVVVFNRLVWGPLYRLAETRYALNR